MFLTVAIYSISKLSILLSTNNHLIQELTEHNLRVSKKTHCSHFIMEKREKVLIFQFTKLPYIYITWENIN